MTTTVTSPSNFAAAAVAAEHDKWRKPSIYRSSSIQKQAIQTTKPGRHAPFIAILALRPHQIPSLLVIQDLEPAVCDTISGQPTLSPQTRTKDAELADHVSADNCTVRAEDGVLSVCGGFDQLHEDVGAVVVR